MAVDSGWRVENRPKQLPLLLLKEARPGFCEQLQDIKDNLKIPQTNLKTKRSIKTYLFLPIHMRKALMTRKAMAPAVKPYAASGNRGSECWIP